MNYDVGEKSIERRQLWECESQIGFKSLEWLQMVDFQMAGGL